MKDVFYNTANNAEKNLNILRFCITCKLDTVLPGTVLDRLKSGTTFGLADVVLCCPPTKTGFSARTVSLLSSFQEIQEATVWSS